MPKVLNMTEEKAREIAEHLKAALEADPSNEAIAKTNQSRLNFAVGKLESRIARGEFPTLARLRAQFGVE